MSSGPHAPLALVTGASSGIGRAFARRLAADGYNLIVVGRRQERLDELAAQFPGVTIETVVADLGTDAGMAHYMPFIDLPVAKATEFHERQGLDLSAVPRMSADDVVTASLRGLDLGEVVCAPGVERSDLLSAVFQADLLAFGGQSPQLAERYKAP